MKKIIIAYILLLSIHIVSFAQDDDYCYACYNEDYDSYESDPYWYDEQWIERQQRLIEEGYLTIFDTDAYQNGDYYIREDGRVALGKDPNYYNNVIPITEEDIVDYGFARSMTEKEKDEYYQNLEDILGYSYYSGYMGDNQQDYKPTPTPKPKKSTVTWHCVDWTTYDGNAYNDNKCTSSTGQVRYVADSEAKKLDPSYRPGKSGDWYYNNK